MTTGDGSGTRRFRNTSLSKDNRVEYRIGVNLGDVIVHENDVFGDGVNIAARLEQAAQPGTVNISGGVYEQIKNKLVVGYQSLGDEKLKNITDPVSRNGPRIAGTGTTAERRGMDRCGRVQRVLRGGSWLSNDPLDVRVTNRAYYEAAVRYPAHGFRVVRPAGPGG